MSASISAVDRTMTSELNQMTDSRQLVIVCRVFSLHRQVYRVNSAASILQTHSSCHTSDYVHNKKNKSVTRKSDNQRCIATWGRPSRHCFLSLITPPYQISANWAIHGWVIGDLTNFDRTELSHRRSWRILLDFRCVVPFRNYGDSRRQCDCVRNRGQNFALVHSL